METEHKTAEPKQLAKKPGPIWVLLSGAYKKAGTYWAKKMERLTAGFTKRTWMLVLFFYLLLGSVFCLYIMYSSI